MRRFLVILLTACCTALAAHAQTAVQLPYAAQAVADIGNGPVKVRVTQGNASIFTSQGSGVGSTSGSSTALTLTTTPTTPPIVGGLISGSGITSGTTVAAYDGTTGVTLSAAMTIPASTTVSWGAACPSSSAGIPSQYIQASVMADYYLLYTQARVCAISPGGANNALLILPVFYDQTSVAGGGVTSWNARTGAVTPQVGDYNFNQLSGSIAIGQIPSSLITYAKLQNEAATTLLCNPTGSPAAPSECTLVSGSLRFVGTTLDLATTAATPGTYGSATKCASITVDGHGRITAASDTTCTPAFSSLTGSIAIGQIPNSLITYAKLQNEAATTLLCNPTGSPAAPSECTLGTGLSFAGSVLNASGGGSAAGTYTLQYISGAWGCTDPTGAVVSISGTTTSGLQECINAMQTNKTGNFRAVCPPNHPIAATTTVTFGPAGEGYNYTLNGCILTSSATNSVIVDTFAQGSSLLWDGHIHYEGNSGYAVQIQPANPDPTNGGYVTIGANIYLPEIDIHNSSCTTGSVVALLRFDTTQHSTSAIVNNLISVAGLDGGPSNCNSYGVYVDTPTNTFQGFGQNIIRILINGSFSNSGFNVCNSSSNTNSCATNDWTTSITITSAVANMVLTGGFLDTWHILSASINAGSCTNGIFFVGGGTQASPTGAWGNAVYSTQIGCTNPIVMGNSLMNSIVNPGQGGAYTAFTPTPLTCVGGTVNSASATGYYQIIGHTVNFNATLNLTTLTTCTLTAGGGIGFNLPLKISARGGMAFGNEVSTTGNMLQAIGGGGSATMTVRDYNNLCAECISGRVMFVTGSYEFQ